MGYIEILSQRENFNLKRKAGVKCKQKAYFEEALEKGVGK